MTHLKEYVVVSVFEGSGHKPKLGHLWSLIPHRALESRTESSHLSVVDITTWGRVHIGKHLTKTEELNSQMSLKILQRLKTKHYFELVLTSLDSEARGMDHQTVALWSRPKTKRSRPDWLETSTKTRLLSWFGVVSVPFTKVLYISVMASLIQKNTWGFRATYAAFQDDMFPREVHAFFKKTVWNHIMHTVHRLRRKGVYWTGLPAAVHGRECLEDFETKNVWKMTPHCYTL